MAYKKGESGNLKGRPKRGETMRDIIQSFLDKTVTVGANKITQRELLTRKLFKMAMEEDMQAVKLLVQYDAGMPVQVTMNADADNETTKIMQDHARKIFGSKK